jgi:hypothetical protein
MFIETHTLVHAMIIVESLVLQTQHLQMNFGAARNKDTLILRCHIPKVFHFASF